MNTSPPTLAPVASGLFAYGAADPEAVYLLAARDAASGRVVFPCPQPLPSGWDMVELPREGSLWSFTVQRFRPKSPPYVGPEAFEPYAVGYVELPDAVIVESRLTGIAFDDLVIGMPLRLTTVEVDGRDGGRYATYAFTHAGERA